MFWYSDFKLKEHFRPTTSESINQTSLDEAHELESTNCVITSVAVGNVSRRIVVRIAVVAAEALVSAQSFVVNVLWRILHIVVFRMYLLFILL